MRVGIVASLLLSATVFNIFNSASADEVCSNKTFPFIYQDINGNEVSGVQDQSGQCIFPSSACSSVAESGSGKTNCCRPAPYTTGYYYMFIAFALIMLPQFVFIPHFFHDIYKRHPEKLEGFKFDNAPPWLRSKLLAHIWNKGIWVGTTAFVVIPIFMKQSIQEQLTVSSRNVLQSAEAFLVPYKEIFQFVEDIVSIKINYALSSRNKSLANTLVHLGLAASLISGLGASAVAAILGVFPRVLQALTNPGLHNDLTLYPDCNIVEASQDSDDLIRPYWQIEVWKFLGTQVVSVLAGFMFGALEYDAYGWIMALGLGTLPLIWFTGLDNPIEPLILLAWGEFSVSYVTLALTILYLTSPLGSSIRDKTGVTLSLRKLMSSFGALFRAGFSEDVDESSDDIDAPLIQSDTAEDDSPLVIADDGEGDYGSMASASGHGPGDSSAPIGIEGDGERSTTRELVVQGLSIMFLDVTVQLAKSLAVYLALLTDGATAYQLTALDSNLPTYGLAYSYGISFTIKVIGPIFLTMQEYSIFFKFASIMLLCAFLLVPLIVGTTIPFRDGLAIESGQNSCVYAGSEECVSFFTKVYGINGTGGDFSLQYTYFAFWFGASIESLFISARALVVTMLDFGYIVKSTGVALVLYVIALVIASLVQPFAKSAIAYFIVMFVPQAILLVLFIGRMYTLYRRMVKGEAKGTMRAKFKRRLMGNR